MAASSSSAATRKVWVRRPGGSATLIAFGENDLVDDVRATLLNKYANSLGRVFDAPDVTLWLAPREKHHSERSLGPDEVMIRTLELYYPGGQTMDEALVIDLPLRRGTPGGASPRSGPREGYAGKDTDYFGPAATTVASTSSYGHTSGSRDSGHYQQHSSRHGHSNQLSLHLHSSGSGGGGGGGGGGGVSATVSGGLLTASPTVGVSNGGIPHHHPHSISVLSTGQVPPIPNLPSPSGASLRPHKDRPKLNRQHSSNPGDYNNQAFSTHGGSGTGQGSLNPKISVAGPGAGKAGSGYVNSGIDGGADTKSRSPGAVQDPMVDVHHDGNGFAIGGNPATSPATRNGQTPPRPASPLRAKKLKKMAKAHEDGGSMAVLGPLTVPPINVLIVEDNIINLKLLEAFVKRLKVRWQTAMNGRDAVIKWRTGGFHLVLMDIQLPLMSGLEATREIRRLERVNSIGVFASTPSDSAGNGRDPQNDKLANIALFKSPVIIVALTASSLQSDRNDALAAGCNDFLTKPVNFVWLEKKIMEWGCMQALIDFDGWRRWKELKMPSNDLRESSEKASGEKKSKKPGHSKRPSLASAAHETGESSDTIATMSSPGVTPVAAPSPRNAVDVAWPTNSTRRLSWSTRPPGKGSEKSTVSRAFADRVTEVTAQDDGSRQA